MNVSPISFAGASSDFQKKIESPQVYKQSEAPAASTKLSESSKKKSSPVKTAAKLAVGAAVIAGGLALGAKYNVFTSDKIKNETVKKAFSYLQTAGEAITGFATKIIEKAKNITSSNENKVAETVEEGIEAVGEEINNLV